MKWHKTAVISRTFTFCVDDKRDAKFTCDVKSSSNDNNQDIGVAKHPAVP